MKRLAPLALLALAACGTTSGAVKVTCGVQVKTFTAAQEQALGVAIAALDPASPIITMGDDWARMRADARACQVAVP